jgi:hypothetical protein
MDLLQTTEPYQATPDVQQKYLALVQYLLDNGIADLLHLIQAAVTKQLEE